MAYTIKHEVLLIMSSTLFLLLLPDPLGLLLFLPIESIFSLLLALFLALFQTLLPLLHQALLELLQFFLKGIKESMLFTQNSALENLEMKSPHIRAYLCLSHLHLKKSYHHHLSHLIDETSCCCYFRYKVLFIFHHPGHPRFVLESLLTLHLHVADLLQMCTITYCKINSHKQPFRYSHYKQNLALFNEVEKSMC